MVPTFSTNYTVSRYLVPRRVAFHGESRGQSSVSCAGLSHFSHFGRSGNSNLRHNVQISKTTHQTIGYVNAVLPQVNQFDFQQPRLELRRLCALLRCPAFQMNRLFLEQTLRVEQLVEHPAPFQAQPPTGDAASTL